MEESREIKNQAFRREKPHLTKGSFHDAPVGKKQTTLLNISAESATFVTVYGHLYTKNSPRHHCTESWEWETLILHPAKFLLGDFRVENKAQRA